MGLAFVGRLALGTELIAAYISPQLIIGALLFSFIMGSLFGTIPAVRASKLNPVDALRYAKWNILNPSKLKFWGILNDQRYIKIFNFKLME